MSSIGHILGKKPNDGLVDEYKDVRLRIGIVDNPTVTRKNGEKLNPLNPIGAVNMDSGKICVRWIDEQGGIVRPPSFKGKQEYTTKTIEGHGVVADVESDTGSVEMLTLTHPMMWANQTNWCGINYLPPVGSVVVIGFKRHGLPVLLGFLQSHYEVCHPIKLGEIMIKGYGKNYTHYKQSSRLEHRVWADAGDVDLDNISSVRKNSSDIDIVMRLDAHAGHVKFDVKSNGGGSSMTITPGSVNIDTGSFNVSAGSIRMSSSGQTLTL